MSKQTMLKIVNVLLFLNIILQGVTGLFRDKLMLNEQAFGLYHVKAGILLLVLVLIHLILNWGWVRSLFARKKKA